MTVVALGAWAQEEEIGNVDVSAPADRHYRFELADAETSYYRMVIDYNVAIMNLNYRKGSLLEYNGITLAEGPWPTKAYFDANTRAAERDAGHYVNYKITEPRVISRGAYPQIQGTDPTIVPGNSGAYLDTQLPTLEEKN